MPPRSDRAAARENPSGTGHRLLRFTAAVRWVHHATAALAGVCVITAACLYVGPLAELVGRRRLVTIVHEWSGVAMFLPVLLGLASRALRSDLTRLNRFEDHDRRWLWAAVRRRRTSDIPSGKFNGGQKAYAAWTAGAGLVMLGTGLMLWFPQLFALSLRTGATFVHDWLALAVAVVVAAHIGKAVGDPEARRGMWGGTVSRAWADREHRLWRAELEDHSAHSGSDRSSGVPEDSVRP
ncbi:formate dehydrogenase [Streptomyces toyocaensis]|uniref:Formate dehydrogenase n=1 Tax=Streptomyces toyocaensis TaxID=55952 RepID=A0A081XJ30_STRTO|nr:cytochrome b/b6 domain-containing protein [Streptomyces toyocaensis]KES03553.1 formate dehydrogenase [Streptomyces toyocaensis]